MINNCL